MDKIKPLIEKNFSFLAIVLVLNLIKLWGINSGLVLGEPDEWNHLEVSRNFAKSIYPSYSGIPFYYSLPLYPFFSYLLSSLISDKFLALRLISFSFSMLIALGIYFYLSKKVDKLAGLLAAIIFTLTPLSIFYSRIGLMEMTLAGFTFLSVTVFEKFFEKRTWRFGFISGVLLGLAILTKYTSLIFVLITALYFLLDIGKLILKKGLTFFVDVRSLFKNYLGATFHFVMALALVAPVILLFTSESQGEFRVQTEYIFSLASGSGIFFNDYLLNSVNYFSLVTILLFLLGLVWLIRKNNWKDYSMILLSLTITFYFIGKRDLTPRYLVVMTPYLSILAGLGAYWVSKTFRMRFKQLFIAVLILLYTPYVHQALKASHHNIVEEVGAYVKEINKDNAWVFTNYWPSVFIDETGSYKTTWLSASPSDSQAFSTFSTSKYEKIQKSSYETFLQEGGIVILEDLYSKNIKNISRNMPIEFVRNNFQPVRVFEDRNSNWPFFNEKKNKISVYLIKK